MKTAKNRWLIAASAVGIHLSIGSVYAWSVFAKPVVTQLGWDFRETQFTFSIAILFLGLSAATLGRFVERQGPRRSGTLASFFFGIGIAGSGLAIEMNSLHLLYACYGVLGGIGLGVGYIAPVSTLVKWFPDRRGLATGLAIMGFGFASLIGSPIIQRLIVRIGLAETFFILGAAYFCIMFAASQYLAPPPPGWMPETNLQKSVSSRAKERESELLPLTATEALRTRRFYWLWLMLYINVTCGIAIISVASPMGQEVVGMSPLQAAAMVGVIGLFNGGGRIAWAFLSDYIGRANTYTAFFVIQLIGFFLLPKTTDSLVFQGLLFLIMTCYGGGFSCVPAFIGDIFGTKQLAAIHGNILTAWAAAGLTGPMFAAWVRETTGNYSGTLSVFVALFAAALVVSFLIRLDSRPSVAPASRTSLQPAGGKEEIAFPARIAVLREVMDFVAAHARKAKLPDSKISEIQLAVEEAVANICGHAYAEETAVNLVSVSYHSKADFLLRVRHEPTTLEIDLLDRGHAFNPLSAAPPRIDPLSEDTSLKGLGIYLMRRMVDDLRYRRERDLNVLTLVVRLDNERSEAASGKITVGS
ncbi:MAG: MFS transporter [Deltaproteobacteria bacterium HGW-Deltaproteobacteria-15]|nr:MAG: MFS transporter [Deltaproteobacteria bacterium HGW-Deltaproteobacteria-15]